MKRKPKAIDQATDQPKQKGKPFHFLAHKEKENTLTENKKQQKNNFHDFSRFFTISLDFSKKISFCPLTDRKL